MRLVDFFFALRPLVLVPAWSFFLLGYGASRSDHGGALPFPALPMLLLSIVLACVYLVNQVVDFESDRLNGKGLFLQRRIFSRRLYACIAGCGLLLGTVASAVLHAAPLRLALVALLGLAYSLPPLRLAARPGLDLLANACGYGCIAFLLGAGDDLPAALWLPRVAAGTLAVGAVFLHTTLLDLEGDERTAKRTSGVALGAPRARLFAAVLGLAAAACAPFSHDAVLATSSLALALALVPAALWPAHLTSRTLCVGGTALFALAAAVRTPIFLLVVLFLALSTRLYYRRRFALSYPTL